MNASKSTRPIVHFDAHIYFTAETRAEAAALREKALAELAGKVIGIYRLVDRNVGPHTRPMFEIQFAPERLGEMILWLMAHRGSLAVLVHQVTGDDLPDHYAGALWMGEMLPLDDSRLSPSP